MSNEVAGHYEKLLANHYTWMFGVPFEAKVEEQLAMLAAFGFGEEPRGFAVDLGCGPGFQAFALARLGFRRVLAVDTSEALLAELAAHRGDLPVEPALADLRDLPSLIGPGEADAVVCMGDTLTHLPSWADVSRLLADARAALAPGGRLALTFRDLSAELTGTDRIIPVQADADRIMTCLLDYEPETVVVTDIFHTREGGGWRMAKSSYRKLRLAPGQVADELERIGYVVERSEPVGRMHALVARRE